MKKQLTLNDVVKLLRQRCTESGTQKAFAEASGVSPQYVADVLRLKREPGEAILSALGLEKVVSYREKVSE